MEITFNTLDWVMVGIILLSMTLSLFYGFIKECLSLIKWFASFTLAKLFYENLAHSGMLSSLPENVRIPVAILSIFFVSIVAGTILIELIIRILRKTSGSINLTDRVLGLFFGALRGVMIVCLGLAICKMGFSLGLFNFVQKMPIWAESYLIPEFDKIVVWFFDKIDLNGMVNGLSDQLTSPLDPSASADPSAVNAVDAQPLTEEEKALIQNVNETGAEKAEK